MSERLGKQKGAARSRYHREALGLKVGYIVTTSYGTGPYEVWAITAPRLVTSYPNALIVRAWPVVDLALIVPQEAARHSERRFYGINSVRQQEGRWLTDQLDEVLVQPSREPLLLPIHPTYSYPPLPEPYPFQRGVDYRAGHRQVWHCARCGLDWNEARRPRWEAASCPACQGWGIPIVFMHDPTTSQSECVLALNA